MAAPIVTGLDIGTFAIKAVTLVNKGKSPQLVSFGMVKTPQPGLSSDTDIDLEAVATACKSLLNSLKAPFQSVVVSFPESKIFSRVISDLPFLTDEELGNAIKFSAEEFVPLPIAQIELYWQVISRSKEHNQTIVLVIAVPKKLQTKYLKVLEIADIKPSAIETEMIAASRILVTNNITTTTMILQLGATTTDMSIISNGIIVLTRSIQTAGLSLTRAVAQHLNFPALQAEEYKKVYGLLPDQMEGRIYQALKPLIDIIATEAERTIQSYQLKNPTNPVKRIVLIGGGAKMPGLVNYMVSRFGLEIQQADPFATISKDESIANKITTDPSFCIATGLALRQD
jgi:type IV pilus assembly protein PilM